jgi:hypothetical protein
MAGPPEAAGALAEAAPGHPWLNIDGTDELTKGLYAKAQSLEASKRLS